MFIFENVLIILTAAVVFFILYTILNILVFTKDFLTGVFLTVIFFDLFFRMPFKAVNKIYNDREKNIRKIEKTDLSQKNKEKAIKIFQSRRKIFFILYKTGELSYSGLMLNFKRWYTKKPFKVRIKVIHMNRKRFENKYFNDLQKDLSTMELI